MDFNGFVTLIEGLGTGDKNTALEMRTFLTHLIQSIFEPGDIKIVNCTQEEFEADFTSTGLGIGKRSGWALCNGLNGTPPYGGRTPIGWSEEYPVIGHRDGEKTHKLTVLEMPNHDHTIPARNGSGSIGGAEFPNGGGTTVSTSKAGGDQPHNNMQPYIVQLFLMKL